MLSVKHPPFLSPLAVAGRFVAEAAPLDNKAQLVVQAYRVLVAVSVDVVGGECRVVVLQSRVRLVLEGAVERRVREQV